MVDVGLNIQQLQRLQKQPTETVKLWARQLNNDLKLSIKLHKAEGELQIQVIII